MAGLLVFLTTTLFTWSILRLLVWRHHRILTRVAALAQPSVAQMVTVEDSGAQGPPTRGRIGVKSSYVRIVRGVVRDLESSGITLTKKEWRVVLLVCSTIILLGGLLSRSILGSLFAIVAIVIAFKWFIGFRKKRRVKDFEDNLGDMLTIAAGALRAGYSFLQAIDILASETKGRMSEEFRRILREMTFGVGLEDALQHASLRIGSTDFELIVNAVLIQRQVGGNLAEVLDTAGETIRERMRMKGEIRSLTAQGRLSMWIFILLSPAIALFLYVFNPGYISVLWQTTGGLWMLGVALAGQVIGTVLIKKIVNVDF